MPDSKVDNAVEVVFFILMVRSVHAEPTNAFRKRPTEVIVPPLTKPMVVNSDAV